MQQHTMFLTKSIRFKVKWNKINQATLRWCFGTLMSMMLGCNRGDVPDEKITQDFGKREFTWVEVNNVFDIYLVQDSAWSVSIKGSPNAMEGLEISYIGDTLILDRSRKGEYLRPKTGNPAVYLHFDSLSRINTNESCHITSLNAITGYSLGIVDKAKLIEVDLELNNRTFYYWNNPNGSLLHLKGRTLELKLWHSGLSSVDATALEADLVIAENASQGESRVHCNNELIYKLASTGNVILTGTPFKITKIPASGTGKLIHEY
jgi:hypothetical protein